MTSKKPQLAPTVQKPSQLPRPTGPPPPRVDRCPTCDAMAAKIARMEEALRAIRTMSDPSREDILLETAVEAIYIEATTAILGR